MRGQIVKINLKKLQDKIAACWIGKNIGGTIGGPYENKRDIFDVKGYTTPPGEPLPNDDLDLQLAWLTAMEDIGPASLTANHLTWYWVKYIYPEWNEYGVGKGNMKVGFLPPLSGEFRNERWKNSNGAWIRSEIWATLAPGFPDIAIKYAIMDASVDHGIAEGTIAEIYTAALESMAFVESDIRTLINKALEYIPSTSYIAKAVKLVCEEYDKGTPWKETRGKIVSEINSKFAYCGADGWFQAPGNIGFMTLGLLYGEGDFKKSVLTAVNCGDDTDCTAGTVGAILGIIGGREVLPADWCEYIGDKIVTCSLDRSFSEWKGFEFFPKSCSELTDRVMRLMPNVLHAHKLYVEDTNDINDGLIKPENPESVFSYKKEIEKFLARPPYSFDRGNYFFKATVWFDKEPVIKPNETIEAHILFKNVFYGIKWAKISAYAPEGWALEYEKAVCLTCNDRFDDYSEWTIRITAGENVDFKNTVPINVEVEGYPEPITIPLVILG